MAVLLQDLRYGARLLMRSPAMTAVVVLSLALGIGANTTIFTLVNAVLLNPLPVRDASQLVRVVTTEVRDGVVTPLGAISRLNAVDVRDKNVVFDGVAAAGFAAVALSSGGGEPEQVFAQIASGNFFDVLGPPMAAGRTFVPDEDAQLGASPVVVLTYGLWQRRFGGRQDLIGQPIVINGQPVHRDRRDRRGLPRHGDTGRPGTVGADVDVPRGAHGPGARLLQLAPRR